MGRERFELLILEIIHLPNIANYSTALADKNFNPYTLYEKFFSLEGACLLN